MSPFPTTPGQDPAGAPSSPSSTGSPAAHSGGLVGDAGPVFDPGNTPPPAPNDAGDGPDLSGPGWTTSSLKGLLQAQGTATHAFVAVGPKAGVESDEWLWLDQELDVIVPALKRILNRIPAARAAAAGGDAMAVGATFLGYGARSIAERQAIVAQLRDAQARGRPAAPAPGPAEPVDVAEAAGADEDDLPPLSPRRP